MYEPRKKIVFKCRRFIIRCGYGRFRRFKKCEWNKSLFLERKKKCCHCGRGRIITWSNVEFSWKNNFDVKSILVTVNSSLLCFTSIKQFKKTKPNNNDLLSINNLLAEYEGQFPKSNSYFRNTYQSRKHTLYVTIQRTNIKPNFSGIAVAHTQCTGHHSSPSNTFSQSEPNADISSPTNAVSHHSNKNSRYWSTIFQHISNVSHAGRTIMHLHYDWKWKDKDAPVVEKLTTS